MSVFSEYLKQNRILRGFSQEVMAKELSIVFRTYRRYERGETEPILSDAARIADYFDVSLDVLAGRRGDAEP